MTHSVLKNWPILSLLKPDFVSELNMVMVYGSLGNEALMVTKDDTVYALGVNTLRYLRIPDESDTMVHRIKINILTKKKITTFAYGLDSHLLALTESGQVYVWGRNQYGQLGNGTTSNSFVPAVLGFFANSNVIEVACSSNHCVALTKDRKVYSWGQCLYTQSRNFTLQSALRSVDLNLKDCRVVGISCGRFMHMLVISCGQAYGWGINTSSRLGYKDYERSSQLCKVRGLEKVFIRKIICGDSHILALSAEHSLYVWGNNNDGQLGLGTFTEYELPKKKMNVPKMGKIADIGAIHAGNISVTHTHTEEVYIWRVCRGQKISTPTLTPFASIHEALAAYALPSIMHTPLKLPSVDADEGILDCFKQAFDDPSSSDLTMKVHGKPIHVHKILLTLRSLYFRSMFQEHWKESNRDVIEHDEFSYEVYRAFLKYLYTDEIDLPAEGAFELFLLADMYSEEQLKRRCVQKIKFGITVDDVVFIYKTAIQHECEDLVYTSFNFALNDMTAVVQTAGFAELDKTIMKDFITRAAEAGAESSQAPVTVNSVSPVAH